MVLASCGGPASTLDPAGPRAAVISELHWIMATIATAVCVLVGALLIWAVVRSRGAAAEPDLAPSGSMRDRLLIVGGGILLPLLVLPLIWVLTLRAGLAVARPRMPIQLTVEIVGRQWYYEVRYLAHGVSVRDELRLPADTAVLLRVTAADVIHSFWIPRLMGKIDMIPGRINERWVEGRPGTYLAECGEFCGLHHAAMRMPVVVEPQAGFQAWLEEHR
jgi:cytochrome c oxidase subunit 2